MLHKAIKRASKFAPRGKNAPPTFQAVRWLPAPEVAYLGQAQGSWVVAFDGTVGIAIHVGEALPSVLLPTDGLSQAVASPIASVVDQGVSVALETQAGGTFQIPKRNPEGFPLPPRGHAFLPWPIWHDAVRVIHAAAGAKTAQPMFGHACLRPAGLEVTDGVSVAHAPGHGWESQVCLPARMLDPAPVDGAVEMAIDEHYAIARLAGIEYRWGQVRRDFAFPDCRTALASAEGRGGVATVSVKAFREAVRQAVSISVSSAVGLTFDGPGLGLLGWRGAGESTEHAFDVTLPLQVVRPLETPLTIFLDGKVLARALRAVDTPMVMVGYSGEYEPVRLSWAGVAEMIWPWRL